MISLLFDFILLHQERIYGISKALSYFYFSSATFILILKFFSNALLHVFLKYPLPVIELLAGKYHETHRTNENVFDLWQFVLQQNPKVFRSITVAKPGLAYENYKTTMPVIGTYALFFKDRALFFARWDKEPDSDFSRGSAFTQITCFGPVGSISKLLRQVPKHMGSSGNIVYEGTEIQGRSLNTLFYNDNVMERIMDAIKDFSSEEQKAFCNSTGIPRTLGILLYGEPGTGKTSLARALATYLDLPIWNRTLGRVEEFDPVPYIGVIDDFDRIPQKDRSEKYKKLMSVLESPFNIDGTIFIGTVNSLEHVPNALIRPGRFDLVIHIGLAEANTCSRLYNRFAKDQSPKEKDLFVELATGQSQALLIGALRMKGNLIENLKKVLEEREVLESYAYEDISENDDHGNGQNIILHLGRGPSGEIEIEDNESEL